MSIDNTEATAVFIEHVLKRAFQGVIDDAVQELLDGPAGRSPWPWLVKLHKWYSSQDESNKEMIGLLIRSVADSAVFGALAVLDRVSGTPQLGGKAADYALYVQVFDNHDDIDEDKASDHVRINGPSAPELLHDVYRGRIDPGGFVRTGS